MSLKLVTGAPGWLGTRLVRVLLNGLPDVPALAEPARDLDVRCLILPNSDTKGLKAIGVGISLVEGDLRRDEDVRTFCRGAEGATLFHCAGVIHPARRAAECVEVNFEGTKHLLEAAEAAGVRRAVVVSSNSPIGTNPTRDHLFDEHSSYRPYMTYGRSKVLMEKAVAEIQARGKLETVIIRPPWFYGPDQPPRQTLFFRMIKEGKAPIVGDGDNRRSMAYIDNICQGLLLCEAVKEANGRTYWIADRSPYTMNEIVDTIERLLEEEFGMQVAHKRMRLPHFAGEVAWLCDWLIQKAGFYQQKIHVLSEMNKNIACSVARAEKELGYDPKIALEEGMRRSIRWCLDHGHDL
ncbi:MAG: NAD(P)-dependent oxidoreductase [Phycisphaerae bacterium]|nr:NAD(P)-dependent oxidoreductase [Phycisphaerae bacterium]